MSVEKMTMMNIIGRVDEVDSVLNDILQTGKMDLVDAISQIEENNFLFDVSDENIDRLIDLNYISTYEKDERYEDMFIKVKDLRNTLGLEPSTEKKETIIDMSNEEILSELESIVEEVSEPKVMIEAMKKELAYLEDFYANSFKELREFSIPISDLRDMEYFSFKMGILSKEDRHKLKKNYENILAIILHTGTSADGEVYFVIYPSTLEEEMKRILRSLNFREITIPKDYTGTPQEIREQILQSQLTLKKEIEGQETYLSTLKAKYKDRVEHLYEQIRLISGMDDIKSNIAYSKRFFYMSGWVARSDRAEFEDLFKKYDEMLVLFKDETSLQPPTKLKNNWFFKPFEWMVNMYGTPAYNEIDPTPFVSLSYMFLFGMMFGDLGQGLILVIAGMFLSKKMKLFGGIITRLGIASMVFGLFYGAVFGIETLIPALVIKPFENINTVLLIAIVVGVSMLVISYIFSIINSLRRHDIEEGLFGKEGVAGVVLYVTVLALVGGNMLGLNLLPMPVGIAIAILCLLSIVFRLPLTHLIEKKRPLVGDDAGGYYAESVFSLIETFLGMLSGTVSFIRVGAFALTHVGLFLAFETIGHMIGTSMGNIIVLIIGNIFIIGLEGLIVFIQGMRLQYYELFSRYYKGSGRVFNPVKIEN